MALRVPEFKCTLRADECSRMFKEGFRFPEPMTNKELCQFISSESNKAGFDPLRPRLLSVNRTLDYVIFTCVHSRDHGDQSRETLGKPTATSKRANQAAKRPRVQGVVSTQQVLDTVRRRQAQREVACDGDQFCKCRNCLGIKIQ